MNYEVVAFWSQIAGFVAFAVTLTWMGSKWLMPAVAAGQKASNDRIALAQEHLNEMKGALDALRTEIEGARHDADAIKQRAAEQSKHEQAAIIDEAQKAGERAVRGAEGELARARAEAREKLRDALLMNAFGIARTQAEKRVDASVNATLIDEFVSSIEHGGLN